MIPGIQDMQLNRNDGQRFRFIQKTGDGRLASRRAVGGWTEKTVAAVPTQATHRKLSDIKSHNYKSK